MHTCCFSTFATRSSNINEVASVILNSFIRNFNNHKQSQNASKRIKIKNAIKKHLRRKIFTYSLICVFVLLSKCLCAVQCFKCFLCFQCFQCFQCEQNLFIKKKLKTVLITSFTLLLRQYFSNLSMFLSISINFSLILLQLVERVKDDFSKTDTLLFSISSSFLSLSNLESIILSFL